MNVKHEIINGQTNTTIRLSTDDFKSLAEKGQVSDVINKGDKSHHVIVTRALTLPLEITIQVREM